MSHPNVVGGDNKYKFMAAFVHKGIHPYIMQMWGRLDFDYKSRLPGIHFPQDL